MYPSNLAGWIPVNGASLSLQRLATPLSWALPYSMNVAATASSGKIGFANTGYWGMDVKMQTYSGSFYVKGVYEGSFTASLQSNLTGDVFGSVDVVSQSVAGEWTQHNFTLVPSKAAPNSNNTFAITFDPTVSDASCSSAKWADWRDRRVLKMGHWTSTLSASSLRLTRTAPTA